MLARFGRSAGVYTDDIVKKFEILERSAAVTIGKTATNHNYVAKMSAKVHGLYWLFMPGCGLLAKMAEYMNESMALIVFREG